MKIVIAGGTGFVGRHLVERLKAHELVLLTRGSSGVQWDGKTSGPWEKSLEGAQAVINLCGQGVADKGWTEKRKKELLDSRVQPTRALVEAMGRVERRPAVLVNASAVGFYGEASGSLAEDRPRGEGFLAEVCAVWEAEARKAETLGVRVVMTRFGVILGKGGGAMAKMLPAFKLGVGGRLGTGEQWFPWVHIDDAAGLVEEALTNERLRGPINVVSPNPATNAEFTKALGAALHRPAVIPAPAFALKLALGERATMLLASQKVEAKAALSSGYRFRHADLDEALRTIA